MRELIAIALVLTVSGCGGSNPPGPGPGPGPTPTPPPTPGVVLVNMIPASLSGETNQDSEPFLAINATNPQLMAASAFTPNPGGPSSTTAPIFVSQDGGNTWTVNVIIPSANVTHDITHAFDGNGGDFYAGILAAGGSL